MAAQVAASGAPTQLVACTCKQLQTQQLRQDQLLQDSSSSTPATQATALTVATRVLAMQLAGQLTAATAPMAALPAVLPALLAAVQGQASTLLRQLVLAHLAQLA